MVPGIILAWVSVRCRNLEQSGMSGGAGIWTVEKINRYRNCRKNLELLLSQSPEKKGATFDDELRQAEIEIEEAYANLLDSQPKDVSELLSKSHLLIGEVIAEAVLTRYQIQGLESILTDMANLVSTIQTHKTGSAKS